jgi:hypothetical protein
VRKPDSLQAFAEPEASSLIALTQAGWLGTPSPTLASVDTELGFYAYRGVVGDEEDVDPGRLTAAGLSEERGVGKLQHHLP